jgi:hypothetical protein
MSSTVSALLLDTTVSDLNRFFTVSRPFDPPTRARFCELHSLGTCNEDALAEGVAESVIRA